MEEQNTKKYFVEVNVMVSSDTAGKMDRKDWMFSHSVYECESYEISKNWTGKCIRLIDVNTYDKKSEGNVTRKQLKRAKYITIEMMKHWEWFEVIVWENGTDNI